MTVRVTVRLSDGRELALKGVNVEKSKKMEKAAATTEGQGNKSKMVAEEEAEPAKRRRTTEK